MMLPGPNFCSMSVPSYWFKVRSTGKCRKVSEPHPDGKHLRMEYDIRWYPLDDLEPITEEEFNDWVTRMRNESLARGYPT